MQLRKIAGGQGFWYLASPFSAYQGGIEIAFVDIAVIAGRLVREGVYIFCPITHSYPINLHSAMDQFDYGVWLPLDKQIALGANGIIIAGMKGWRSSHGISEEIKWFRAANKPIYLLDPAKLSLKALHLPAES